MCSLRCCWSSLHRLIQDVLPYRSCPHCGVSTALVLRGLRAQLCGFDRPMRACWGGRPGVGSSYHTARTAKLVQALVLWHLSLLCKNFPVSLCCVLTQQKTMCTPRDMFTALCKAICSKWIPYGHVVFNVFREKHSRVVLEKGEKGRVCPHPLQNGVGS